MNAPIETPRVATAPALCAALRPRSPGALRAALARMLWLLLSGLVAATHAPETRARSLALLVGVGDHGHAEHRLEGPAHDVAALGDVLVRRWGFERADVHTLVEARATRPAVQQALADLLRRSRPGDSLLIYFSGLGAHAPGGTAGTGLPHGAGAFVPHGVDTRDPADLARGLFLVRSDLLPVLRALDDGDRRVWLVFDAGHSGERRRSLVVEAVEENLPARHLPLPAGALLPAPTPGAGARPPGAEPYPFRAVTFLGAASEGEVAKDIPRSLLGRFPTVDGLPHGALTDALLRVLEGALPADLDRNGTLDLDEVHRAVGDFMARRSYGHGPQRRPAVGEDDTGLGVRPVLAARGAAAGPGDRPPGPLRLALAPGVPPEAANALTAVTGVVAAGAEEPDIVVQLARGAFTVYTSGGDLVAEVPGSEIGRLGRQVRQLAWAHRLRQLAERHRRGALPLEIHPPSAGGTFPIGSAIHFVVRPERQAWLLMVNIDSLGRISVLYPYATRELLPLPAVRARAIPGAGPRDRIQVKAPEGMDVQMVFAFDSEPPGLRSLMRVEEAEPDDPRLAGLEPLLLSMSGRYAFSQSVLRVTRASAAEGAPGTAAPPPASGNQGRP